MESGFAADPLLRCSEQDSRLLEVSYVGDGCALVEQLKQRFSLLSPAFRQVELPAEWKKSRFAELHAVRRAAVTSAQHVPAMLLKCKGSLVPPHLELQGVMPVVEWSSTMPEPDGEIHSLQRRYLAASTFISRLLSEKCVSAVDAIDNEICG